jgi:hypothetical protein
MQLPVSRLACVLNMFVLLALHTSPSCFSQQPTPLLIHIIVQYERHGYVGRNESYGGEGYRTASPQLIASPYCATLVSTSTQPTG